MALSNVRWEGLEVIDKMAKVLPSKIANQKMRAAFKYALTPVRERMRALIPQKTGALWYATDITINTGKDLKDFVGVVGPRRRRGVWNQQGWHAHLIEKGTKSHTIRAKNVKAMPVYKGGNIAGYSNEITVKGTRSYKPFSRGIDSSWNDVGNRISEKASEVLRDEIKGIQMQFGSVAKR